MIIEGLFLSVLQKVTLLLPGRISSMYDFNEYRKVPKFLDTRKLCCNLPKIQTKRPNLRLFGQEDANEIANSVDPDQTAPLGAV